MSEEKILNTEKKIDRRVVKTKKAICNAFAQLLAEKDINDITIKNVADLADVDRKTVYNYYGGIHEILDEIENKLVDSYEKIISTMDLKTCIENPYYIFNTLSDVLNNNIDFYSRLLKINTNSQLVKKIVTSLINRIKETFLNLELFPKEKVDLISTFVVSGMFSAYQYWFNSGKTESLEDFSKDVSNLVLNGIKNLVNE